MFNKKSFSLFLLIMFMMITGGYFLGTYVGQQGLVNNIKNTNEKLGYQTMQSESEEEDQTLVDLKSTNLITDNTLLVFQKNYSKCYHQKTEERKAEKDEIGLNRQEIGLKFPEWNINEFTQNKIILIKEIDDYCPKHFILKDEGGKLVIYMPSDEEQFKAIEDTGILTEILPANIQEEIRKGLIMDSLEEVEHFMENWES